MNIKKIVNLANPTDNKDAANSGVLHHNNRNVTAYDLSGLTNHVTQKNKNFT